MKFLKTLVFAAVAGVLTLAASKASAGPLYVMSFNAQITANPSFLSLYATNATKALNVRVSLKQLMQLITNAVFQGTGTNPPANARLAWDPYDFLDNYDLFLTNNSGYYQPLTGVGGLYASIDIEQMATSFKRKGTGFKENDAIVTFVNFEGYDLNGQRFVIYQYFGGGTLAFEVPDNGTDVGTMVVRSAGSQSSVIKSHDEGVSTSSITLKGNDVAAEEPFFLWWF